MPGTATRELASGRAFVRQLGSQAFARASGAPLRERNAVRILADASENYPAWLAAIGAARRTIHFEMYILHEDELGRTFADALVRKTSEGIRVRLLYDWMGGFRKTSRGFWDRLRKDGVDVRCFNPPRLDQPLGWLNRDHRKLIVVDGTIAFVSGLCVGGGCGPAIPRAIGHRGATPASKCAGLPWRTSRRRLPKPGSARETRFRPTNSCREPTPGPSRATSQYASSPRCPPPRACSASISSSRRSRCERCG